MAEATLFRVIDEERRMVIELSNEKYEMYVECERNEARRLGLEEGRTEGRSPGLAEGRAEGHAAGVHQKALETAKNLLEMGLSHNNIAKATGLSVKEIEQL